jgi:hypothetical protein
MFTVAIMAAAFHLCKWRLETKEGTAAHNMGASSESSADAPESLRLVGTASLSASSHVSAF